MQKYSIGEVCKLLSIKPHVLRYWEQEITLLSPRKSDSGRRIYTDYELQILYRLRFLLYEKRYTIEGARKQIWNELDSAHLDLKTSIASIRSDLLFTLSYIRQQQVILEVRLENCTGAPHTTVFPLRDCPDRNPDRNPERNPERNPD